ncbi:hypothetical protein [Sphingomonas radiodurans]|uniref:hypothetical protein n=1 Tax=Sphingomonas radiodurans TaxID=2890321 RepID=UPI001E54A826|nr:hypothetical protein [Sphingomonas radiodurans]WBH15449.1 hypothetical protein LLW23_11450 [Sphingomonas radiodurans]
MRNLLFTISLATLGLAGCVAPPAEPPPRPAPPVALPPSPPPAPVPLASDWRDWPLTPGSWRYERDARGGRALFGAVGADARLVLRCDLPTRRLFLSRAGQAAGPLTVRTSSTTRAVPVQPTGGTMPYVASEHAARDPLLDAMAFSRGRFVIEQASAPTLVVPAHAEIGRVIEDCRG